MGRSLSAQLVLASLLSLAITDIIWVFLVAVDVLSLDETLEVATPKMVYFTLMAGLAFFSLPLAWWGRIVGYLAAAVFAIISLLTNISGVLAAVSGLSVDVNILTGIVLSVFSAILLVSSAKASTQKA